MATLSLFLEVSEAGCDTLDIDIRQEVRWNAGTLANKTVNAVPTNVVDFDVAISLFLLLLLLLWLQQKLIDAAAF